MRRFRVYRKINIALFCLIAVIALGLVGTTYAFFSFSIETENYLITAKGEGAGIYLQEYFRPDDMWLPGETKMKEVWFGNEKDSEPQVVRFTYEIGWYEYDEDTEDWVLWDDLDLDKYELEEIDLVTINWTSEITGDGGPQTWTKFTDVNGVDYYYYNYILPGGERTPAVMTSVYFNKELGSGSFYNDVDDEYIEYDDFSNKMFKLDIRVESLDADEMFTEDLWGMTFAPPTGPAIVWTPAGP